MQAYVVVMILIVAGGTLLDILHKKSAKYFFDNWESAKSKGSRQVGGEKRRPWRSDHCGRRAGLR